MTIWNMSLQLCVAFHRKRRVLLMATHHKWNDVNLNVTKFTFHIGAQSKGKTNNFKWEYASPNRPFELLKYQNCKHPFNCMEKKIPFHSRKRQEKPILYHYTMYTDVLDLRAIFLSISFPTYHYLKSMCFTYGHLYKI